MEAPQIDKLYEEYGRLMVQFELIQNRTNEVKKMFAEYLNQQAKSQAAQSESPTEQPQ